MEQFLFVLYALTACGGALAVVLSQNVVRMAFYLVISLGATAGLFFLLNADFVGAMQLLIYVGGTVVLLIFGVMLTSGAPSQAIPNTPGEILQGAIVGFAFLAMVASTVLAVDWDGAKVAVLADGQHPASRPSGFNPPQEGNTARSIGTALLGVRFDRDLAVSANQAHAHNHEHGHDHDHSHGHAHRHTHAAPAELGTGYLLPFEIVSVHLLVVLVGAAYLARAKRRNNPSVI